LFDGGAATLGLNGLANIIGRADCDRSLKTNNLNVVYYALNAYRMPEPAAQHQGRGGGLLRLNGLLGLSKMVAEDAAR
jgi:hypothetical protein